MVLDDVPRDPDLFVEVDAPLDPDVLGHGDLHVVDVLARPEGLEDGVAEAEDEEVLDRLFPEVVIDPVDLALVEEREQLAVERPRRREVGAEGLLHDHPLVGRVLRVRGRDDEPALLQPADDLGDLVGPDREVKEPVTAGPALLVDALELLLELGERGRIVVIALHVGDALGELVPGRVVERLAARVLGNVGLHLAGEVGLGAARDPDEREALGQEPAQRQVVDRGDQLAPGQIPRGPEDDQRGRRRRLLFGHPLAQRVRGYRRAGFGFGVLLGAHQVALQSV